MSRMALSTLVFAAALMFAGGVCGPQTASAQQDCGCGSLDCGGCAEAPACDAGTRQSMLDRLRRLRRPRRNCPQCDCEHCTLEVSPTEVSRTCFQVEQKQICIPAVRLPWMDCCPGKSCVRTVNVLTVHRYKCPSCEYTWSVQEPEIAQPVDCDPCQSGFAPPVQQFNYVEGMNMHNPGPGYDVPVYDAGNLPMQPTPANVVPMEQLPAAPRSGNQP
ncbi:MAG: hypothetical protein AAF456_02715 [Planctomycetota bacterium]